MTNIQPATDEHITYLEQQNFETVSAQIVRQLIARIRADAEKFAHYRAAMNPDDDQAYIELVEKPIRTWKQRAEAAESRVTWLAGFLHYFCDIWHETKQFRNRLPETWDFDGINKMENNARALISITDLKGDKTWVI